ncbi:putative transporter [Smittium culicis]|uniref:Putative transporter n=1 Tax=Smittium culicis TaxID=133412 RepID=A0A1R1X2W5_9FUNG|nr:putative transporter [Smittium culicis]
MSFTDIGSPRIQESLSMLPQVLNKNQFVGDILVFICAIGTGFTQTMYGKYIKPHNFYSMTFINFSTFSLGLATFLFNWVVIVFLHIFGLEKFVLPNFLQFKFILINTVFGLIYNACFIIVLSLTSPIFAAVGVMLTIPVSILTEIFYEGNSIGISVYFGGIFVIAGFCLLSYVQFSEDHK